MLKSLLILFQRMSLSLPKLKARGPLERDRLLRLKLRLQNPNLRELSGKKPLPAKPRSLESSNLLKSKLKQNKDSRKQAWVLVLISSQSLNSLTVEQEEVPEKFNMLQEKNGRT